jgi:NAD(P)H-hydrate epimerase
VVTDIGLPASVLTATSQWPALSVTTWRNDPGLWRQVFPRPSLEAHKFTRGHAVVVSGPAHATGAARLGARGALRVGAGLVTLVGDAAATAINATHATAVMVRQISGTAGLADFLLDARRNAVLIGPGAGVGADTAADALAALSSNASVVLDADALTSFAGLELTGRFGFIGRGPDAPLGPDDLFQAIAARSAPVVLTPHEGEFKRLFGELPGSKLDRARAASRTSGAIVVLKGPDTVIAAPDGRAAINDNAPPTLATAGSGDVLAGFITGLLAQGMAAFEATCAAVWLHGACASHFGPGLIAEDLPEQLPAVLRKLGEAS